jgi:hypothetical protein
VRTRYLSPLTHRRQHGLVALCLLRDERFHRVDQFRDIIDTFLPNLGNRGCYASPFCTWPSTCIGENSGITLRSSLDMHAY